MASPLLTACVREIKRILSDSRIFLLLIGGPFLYAFLFGGVYWQGRSEYVPIVVVDQDHSALSRELVSALRATDSVKIVGWANSPDELPKLARREIAYGCVVFPANMERDMLAGRSPKVAVLVDGTNTLLAGPILAVVREIVTTYQVGVDDRQLEASGMPTKGAATTARPIALAGRSLFNPFGNYSYYILIGLVCAATQSVIRMAVSVSLGFDSIAQIERDLQGVDISLSWLFASKLIGACVIALPAMYGAVAVVLTLFGTPHRGSLWLVLLACTIYVVLQVAIGYGYFGLCKSPLFALHLHMFMASGLFLLSGFSWPFYAMPAWLQKIAYFLPIFHMNSLMRKVNMMGAPAKWVLPHLLFLSIGLVIACAWGYTAFRKWVTDQRALKLRDS